MTYILELEEEPREVLIGQWTEGVWQRVWSVAEQCLEHFDFKRPSSQKVCVLAVVMPRGIASRSRDTVIKADYMIVLISEIPSFVIKVMDTLHQKNEL